MHTNWDQCPQKAITVSLCDYLRHYTVLYWTMAVWTHTYNRISAESMTKCKRRSLQKREDQVRFQNRKSNCAIFVILAFKSIECFLAFAFRISFYRSFCILAVRIGVAMICKMYTVLPFTLIISSHYLNMFLFFLSLSILAVSVSVLYVFPLFVSRCICLNWLDYKIMQQWRQATKIIQKKNCLWAHKLWIWKGKKRNIWRYDLASFGMLIIKWHDEQELKNVQNRNDDEKLSSVFSSVKRLLSSSECVMCMSCFTLRLRLNFFIFYFSRVVCSGHNGYSQLKLRSE